MKIIKYPSNLPQFNSHWFLVLIFLFVASLFNCTSPEPSDGPAFILQNPKILVKDVISNYIMSAKFDTDSRTIIFNGRLDGDSWDCIYTVPAQGGDYQKIIESTDDLLFPSFSPDQRQIIYTKGFARQIMIYDIESGKSTELPIFGNSPMLLPDNETVMYSGVIDANLRLYHVPTRQSRNQTESYISASFSPVLLSDNNQIRWVEKLRNGIFRLKNAELGSSENFDLFSSPKPLVGITSSPSGQWTLLNYQDGSLEGIHSKDSTIARVKIEDGETQITSQPLFSLPDWSISGTKLVYASVMPERFSTVNPFFKSGYYKADLTIADLKWDKIDNGAIIRPMSPKTVALFLIENEDVVESPSQSVYNNPPRIISVPPTTVQQGDVYIYRIQAIDIDIYDNLKYELSDGPLTAEMLPTSGILYWVAEEPGMYQFSVTVSDNQRDSDMQSFNVEVLPLPEWNKYSVSAKPLREIQNKFLAGMVFKDADNDGFLSPGENAQLLIDLKTRDIETDSIKLQLLTTVSVGEIEMESELIFEHCSPDKWSRKIITVKGLEGLQNRPIVIRGILQNSDGITLLPASLTISARNSISVEN